MPGKIIRNELLPQSTHLVVKVGTNAICDSAGRPDMDSLQSLTRQIATLKAQGINVTLVASGAIGAGMADLNFSERPKTVPQLQATAAVGQGQLMRIFHDLLAEQDVHVGQVLITAEDFEDRSRYLNIRNTLTALHEMQVLPIMNENDATAVYELRFGDNDIIAAHTTNMLSADALVLLTSVDAVLDGDRPLDTIVEVNDEAMALVMDKKSALGSGGMTTKLRAAKLVTKAGSVAVIANARQQDVLLRLHAGETVGTVFVPSSRKLSQRQKWIGMTAKPAGRLIVDDGAVRALIKKGKSLLSSGICKVVGQFSTGDTVSIFDQAGHEIARGLVNYSSDELEKIKGLHSDKIAQVLGDNPFDEIVHRNNMAIHG